ncbi:ogr/Delta-like zinc finger family protein [uncultured Novosphingobium sp.]|uniref:ogr/Delta-like zinc finger family protein n=1 Tax=uncultured Novosphingobium sp. TaxID=292277 RepID=UPI00259701C3|nr:ogr/Delta-like zinc finger family protein [uncultured Novosphingobium sp.]
MNMQEPIQAAADVPLIADDDVSRFAPMRCPHCDSRARNRTSKTVTGQHREVFYQCTFIPCGHTWRASLVYDYGIVPSGIPNPKVDLPLKQMTRQEALEVLRPRDPSQPDMFDAPPGHTPGTA